MYNSFWFILFQKRFINNLFWSETAPVLVAWNQFPSPELYSLLVFTITQPKQWRKGHSLENQSLLDSGDGWERLVHGLCSCAECVGTLCFSSRPLLRTHSQLEVSLSLIIEIIILHCFDHLSLALRVWIVCLLIHLLHGLAMCSISI